MALQQNVSLPVVYSYISLWLSLQQQNGHLAHVMCPRVELIFASSNEGRLYQIAYSHR